MDWDLLLKVGAISAAILAIVGVFVMLGRQGKRLGALSEGIMGKPAVTDYAGETVEKAIPSLQARVGKIEELLIGQADTNNRLTSLEAWRVEHEEFSQEIVRDLLELQKMNVSNNSE